MATTIRVATDAFVRPEMAKPGGISTDPEIVL